jgi:hypothetical protein
MSPADSAKRLEDPFQKTLFLLHCTPFPERFRVVSEQTDLLDVTSHAKLEGLKHAD